MRVVVWLCLLLPLWSSAATVYPWSSRSSPSMVATGGGLSQVVPNGSMGVQEILARNRVATPTAGGASGGLLLKDLLNRPLSTPMGERQIALSVTRTATASAIAKAV